MSKKFPCPNCGKPVEIQHKSKQYVCTKCQSKLLLVANSKLILENPLPYYLDPQQANRAAKPTDQVAPIVPTQPSKARMEKAAVFTNERMVQEKRLGRQGFYAGLGTLITGGLLLLVMGSKLYLTGADWLELLGTGVGSVFIVVGLFITIWFAFSLRSTD